MTAFRDPRTIPEDIRQDILAYPGGPSNVARPVCGEADCPHSPQHIDVRLDRLANPQDYLPDERDERPGGTIMHATIENFYVETSGRHVIMTVRDPGEGTTITVRISKGELATMADADVFYSDSPPQIPTPLPRPEQETRS